MVRIALVMALLGFLPSYAAAQCSTGTCSSDGGVNKPPGWDISLPFTSGENVRVLSGYGPTGGSSLHCRSQDASCANDWYALDLVLPDRPNFGKGQPVLSIADGEVLSAGWGTSGWANYGRRVYIRHTIDGTQYTSMYAHLDSIDVTTGATVRKGQRIGTLGGSCQEQDVCSSFSTPHLHFSIHRGANFGGSGSGGSYGGRAVIPEPIDGHTSLQRNQVVVSKNGQTTPPPVTECNIAVSLTSEALLEEDGPCATRVGSPSDVATGTGGHALMMPLVNPSPDYANGVVWSLKASEAGEYEVWASIPEVTNQASESTYKVQFAGETSQLVKIDQAANAGGEVRLGRFNLDTTSNQWVRLGDNFDDAANQNKNVVLDSLRVFSAAICTCSDPGRVAQPCDDGLERIIECNGCVAAIVTECSEPEPNNVAGNNTNPNNTNANNTTSNNSNPNNDAPIPGTDDPDSPPNVVSTGQACTTTGGVSVVFALLGVVGFRRRRRVTP